MNLTESDGLYNVHTPYHATFLCISEKLDFLRKCLCPCSTFENVHVKPCNSLNHPFVMCMSGKTPGACSTLSGRLIFFFFSSVYVDVEGQTNHRLEQEAENRRLNIGFSGAQLSSAGG